ncbi:MAG TPA: hypothetical protein PKC76_11885 [Saprospiraceae bacterium]|nr:hypothetical protein [Saprospiraceae bacterium]HMP24828.1 hypothetical protein [Saprospiraceae bacterium]
MKRLLFLAALFALATGCEKEDSQILVSAADEVVTMRNTGGGNEDCPDGYEFTSGRIDGGAQCSGTTGPITWETDPTCTTVSWTSTVPVTMVVIVKGGPAANVYEYVCATSGTGLVSPNTPSGNPAELSNITFCWNVCEDDDDDCQWCSPGYWRQPQHLDSWAATGYSPDDKFQAALGYYPTRSRQGVRQNAPTDPTLLQVLQYPQWYGGDAFNAVGDLLSGAHPDVNFCGDRVENSCPLN